MPVIPERVAARAIEAHVRVASGCWVSTYSVASNGYPQIGWGEPGGRRYMVSAHRASWTHQYGQIPAEMTVDHLCHRKTCVNPDHMRLLTNFDNARRNRKNYGDWPLGECRHGHPDSQLVHRPGGKRACGSCLEAWQ